VPDWVSCPDCGSIVFGVERRQREFALVCGKCGRLIRLFFQLTMPDPPPPPERSPRAAAKTDRPR
jgi:hypothetical protein